jgi:hypothetical protein
MDLCAFTLAVYVIEWLESKINLVFRGLYFKVHDPEFSSALMAVSP